MIIEPEELLDKLPTSTESFVGFMHQSYLDFFSSIQDASKAVENLSYAEPFFNEWTVSNFRTKKSGKKSISKTVHIFLGFTFEFLFVLRAGHTRSVNVRDALWGHWVRLLILCRRVSSSKMRTTISSVNPNLIFTKK